MKGAKKDNSPYPTRLTTIWGSLWDTPYIWGVLKDEKPNK
jgi:hypothetical protein